MPAEERGKALGPARESWVFGTAPECRPGRPRGQRQVLNGASAARVGS